MSQSPAAPGFAREFTASLAEIEPLSDALTEWAGAAGVPARATHSVCLMLDELITNVVMHGYGAAGGWVRVEAQVEGGALSVCLCDRAPAFDPLQVAPADTTLSLDDRDIGGLGVHFVRKMADSVHYARVPDAAGDRNQLQIVKRFA